MGVAIGVPLMGAVIRWQNLRYLRANGQRVPKGFEHAFDREMLARAGTYAAQTGTLAILQDLATQALIIAVLFGGPIEWWDHWLSRHLASPTLQGVTHFMLIGFALSLVALPFGYYHDFVIEQRQGFNRSTKWLFLSDFIKGQLLTSTFIAIATTAGLGLIKWSNLLWWFWVWLFLLAFQIFIALIAPRWLEPLFVKVKPLEDENLGGEIRQMAARAAVRVDRVFQVDASRRSNHTNAYFSGFGPVKRVVLFDTLLEKLERCEILAVLAHELGHWRLRHVLKSLVLFQCVALLACFLAYHLVLWDGMLAVFGIGEAALFTRLTLTLYLGSLASFVLTPLFSAISRRHEWQADAFACTLAQPLALASGLVKLARDNLSNIHPHPMFVAFFATHPPTVARVDKLRAMGESP